ncbi:hypothetical protein JG688_00008695, partial [Phytophthora aleatoria]
GIERRTAATFEYRLEIVIRNYRSCSGNAAAGFVDERKIAQAITLQTNQMRRCFRLFLRLCYLIQLITRTLRVINCSPSW